jgi:regulator of nucleoside diphosphate kinase
LVPPSAADPVSARESVLSPIGSALFGLTEGQSIDWPDESGRVRRYTLLKVIFQPEAAGRFDL